MGWFTGVPPGQQTPWQIENLKGAIALAGQTIKSLELVNGAAAIGILTFYGNRHSTTSINSYEIHDALLYFGAGVATAVSCSILAYFSQLGSVLAPASRVEIGLRIIAGLCGIGSTICFVLGVWTAAHAI